ncbi:MAG: replicative DNA helicase [Lachnospiraceae bacterium]|nr:replicative DNA helicase [Lachnospiraceae bacterium]
MDENMVRRSLPYSSEAEQSVIGSMIMDPEATPAVMELLTGDDFYQAQYGALYEVLVDIYNENAPIDLVVIQNKIREKGLPTEVYTPEFIAGLVSAVPSSVNVKAYAEIVRDKAVRRRMIRAAETIANAGYADKDPLDDVLNEAEKQIFDVVQRRGDRDYEDIKDLVIRTLENIEAAARSKGNVTGIATGFHDLDYRTAGLQNSDLVLIAARPSMGKTAFALNIAEHVAVRERITTAIFSLEMSKDQLVKRLFAMNSHVDSQNIRTGNLQDQEWAKLVESARVLGSSNLIIDDTPGISVSKLRSKCRKYKMDHNLGLVIIDYLQLMASDRKSDSRQVEISEISRSLKALARELNVPVIALSQLSRAVEGRPDKRPMLSDLRESGAIEQDADVVMFLYRDDYYHPNDSEKPGVTEIIIGKQRNGPTGTIELAWLAKYTKFSNLEKNRG